MNPAQREVDQLRNRIDRQAAELFRIIGRPEHQAQVDELSRRIREANAQLEQALLADV